MTHGIRIYLDDGATQVAELEPPGVFVLDTEKMADGPHTLRVEAVDDAGYRSVRQIAFEVRNGPGIAIEGLRTGEIVGGKRSLVVNAYAAGRVEAWQPVQAETPGPIPSWAWVLSLIVAAMGVFYVAREWQPSASFASTPTYARSASAAPIAAPADHGAELYRVTCATCHQANGEGLAGAFPPLVHDPVATSPDPREHAEIMLFGLSGRVISSVRYTAQMPAWGAQLSDEEIAAIMNYERTAWGNSAPRTTAQFVASVRAAHAVAAP